MGEITYTPLKNEGKKSVPMARSHHNFPFPSLSLNRTFHLLHPFFSRYEQPDLDGLGGLGDRDWRKGREGTRDPRMMWVFPIYKPSIFIGFSIINHGKNWDIYMEVSKNSGFYPPNHPIKK